jgi:hypothetical protein
MYLGGFSLGFELCRKLSRWNLGAGAESEARWNEGFLLGQADCCGRLPWVEEVARGRCWFCPIAPRCRSVSLLCALMQFPRFLPPLPTFHHLLRLLLQGSIARETAPATKRERPEEQKLAWSSALLLLCCYPSQLGRSGSLPRVALVSGLWTAGVSSTSTVSSHLYARWSNSSQQLEIRISN